MAARQMATALVTRMLSEVIMTRQPERKSLL
jgi:hypothetical protein